MLCVIVASYVALMTSLWRHIRHKENTMFRSHMSAERKAGRTVVMIVSISFLVGVPLLVYFGLVLTGEFSTVQVFRLPYRPLLSMKIQVENPWVGTSDAVMVGTILKGG